MISGVVAFATPSADAASVISGVASGLATLAGLGGNIALWNGANADEVPADVRSQFHDAATVNVWPWVTNLVLALPSFCVAGAGLRAVAKGCMGEHQAIPTRGTP